MTTRWGHCKNCRHFASPAAVPLGEEEASCKQPSIAKFELTVFGACGCNAFEVRLGLPDTVEHAPLAVGLT
jgi:hypothetical protein